MDWTLEVVVLPVDGFADPDGNTWAVQELRVRADEPLILEDARGRYVG